MTEHPLRELFISDFRRLGGHRVLPLDAPIVLIHGPNGAGKTSILSALELALTGEIRSLRRHDPRYTAHLPFYGQQFATVRAEVASSFSANTQPLNMTVGGSRIDGDPALTRVAGQFYAERCYLDQVSLSRLLELYQYTEGKEESALARFVNELLGLEQLDALRSGLSDAGDIRRLRKLSEPLAEAQRRADEAEGALLQTTRQLELARSELTSRREALAATMKTLQLALPNVDVPDFSLRVTELLGAEGQSTEHAMLLELSNSLISLGGRIEGLSQRPSTTRLAEARAGVVEASNALAAWREQHESAIDTWLSEAVAAGVPVSQEDTSALESELLKIEQGIADQERLSNERERLGSELGDRRDVLAELERQLTEATELAGSLVEALSELHGHISDNVCPVCDRDFNEISTVELVDHVDQKIAQLTSHGARLRDLRNRRDGASAEVQRLENLLVLVLAGGWSESSREAAISRQQVLGTLNERLQLLRPELQRELELRAQARHANAELEEVESITRDAAFVASELQRIAQSLGAALPEGDNALEQSWALLVSGTRERLDRVEGIHRSYGTARGQLAQAVESADRVGELKEQVTRAAEQKQLWGDRMDEARRRQSVAKAVQEASSRARTAIVQRVFTESLNEVWRSVFTRLAPREPFVPSFGIPTSSKTALELTLETIHTSGQSGGSPQMMLSAGNLNTAALSLFLALHLAVEPLVPCLVFDDPVQSMDEVHIAQFAGLIRVLAKNHGRQVVIAVHERELFEYLKLELSPAFDGDELITIELGARADDEDSGITRLGWSPDRAVAS